MSFDNHENSDAPNIPLSSVNAQDLEKIPAKLQQIVNSLRPGQKNLAQWQRGQMAVSAVPGAGKSHSLAVAAAIAIARNELNLRQQLIIVTYTRSAAASIKQKIQQQLKELQRPPVGFTVQTLHGLALNIASRHPDLSKLNLDYSTLIVPTPSHRIIRACVEAWSTINPFRYQLLVVGRNFDGEEAERLRRQSVLRTEVLPSLAHTIIREAKSSGLSPLNVWELSYYSKEHYQILAIAAGLYEQYEELMRKYNFIDYDDMILAALRVLDRPPVREVWQNQVFAVFEDEAQDSSPLQSKLLSILATNSQSPSSPPNLIRVGDPNQAINSTFTPADPVYFNWFCERCQAEKKLATMNQAGRSSQIIIDAANYTLRWVNTQENALRSRSASQTRGDLRDCQLKNNPSSLINPQFPFRAQDIQPVAENDPQPEANPAPEGKGLEIYTPDDIYHTVELIGERAKDLLAEHSSRNAAILVRENRQGKFLEQHLAYLRKDHNIPVKLVSEFENYSHIPAEILKILQFVDRPHSPDYLKSALEVLQERQLIAAQDLNALSINPEKFLYPTPLEPPQKSQVTQAKYYCCSLLKARLKLPHYQLISFIGMSLNYTGSELATVEKLSERVNQQIIGHSSLKTTIAALTEIVNSERFEGVEEDSEEQYTRPGQLTIMTMHKAKGLDWDYVFLPFLHEDVLPGKPYVPRAAEFLGDFSLSEVARAQLRAAVHTQYLGKKLTQLPSPEQAWEEANQLKKAEEFRLLYVAMTRAKRLLWMSACLNGPFKWNIFRDNGGGNLQPKTPCPVIPMLKLRFLQSIEQS
jgi:DNA helicase-2/ATP-dependent DNA helicase PcrA